MKLTKLNTMFNSIKVFLYKLWSFLTGRDTAVPYFIEPFNLNRPGFILSGLYFKQSRVRSLTYTHWKTNFHGCTVVLTQMGFRNITYQVAGRYGQHAFMSNVVMSGIEPTENELAKAVDDVLAKLSALPEMEETDEELEDVDVEIHIDEHGNEIPRNKEY